MRNRKVCPKVTVIGRSTCRNGLHTTQGRSFGRGFLDWIAGSSPRVVYPQVGWSAQAISAAPEPTLYTISSMAKTIISLAKPRKSQEQLCNGGKHLRLPAKRRCCPWCSGLQTRRGYLRGRVPDQ